MIVVPREAAGARLDRFLAQALGGLEEAPSRAELQRWIERGRVTVGGAPRKAADKVKDGDQVAVTPEAPPRTQAEPDDNVPFDVLHVDDHLVVIDKPPGLVVHPAKGHESGTLVNGLLARGFFGAFDDEDDVPASNDGTAGLASPAERHTRPGIVHRLDKGTSGVMVVARTPRAREGLKAQFQAHTIAREYVALTAGIVKKQTFVTLHGRSPNDRMKFTSRVRDGKRAVTHVAPIEVFKDATYVACRLETGRTHQIRMHLSESRTPILGDPLYGKPPKSEALARIALGLGHQALHARLLGFVHPANGKTLEFTSEPPGDFQLALHALRALPA